MKKLSLIAAAAALVLALPTMASAQDLNVRIGGGGAAVHHDGYRAHDGYRPAARVVVRGDRGYHRGWRHSRAERVVIVKKVRRHHRQY